MKSQLYSPEIRNVGRGCNPWLQIMVERNKRWPKRFALFAAAFSISAQPLQNHKDQRFDRWQKALFLYKLLKQSAINRVSKHPSATNQMVGKGTIETLKRRLQAWRSSSWENQRFARLTAPDHSIGCQRQTNQHQRLALHNRQVAFCCQN